MATGKVVADAIEVAAKAKEIANPASAIVKTVLMIYEIFRFMIETMQLGVDQACEIMEQMLRARIPRLGHRGGTRRTFCPRRYRV
ncbi:MAG: hypothetical protein AAF566_06870 [Pseudomonadota bacterium]